MKRLNPATGLPFKYGEIRYDKKFFVGYVYSKLKKDGYFTEIWTKNSPSQKDKIGRSKRKTSVVGRATALLSGAKLRAKKKNICFDLPRNWVENKLKFGVCELNGIPFDFHSSIKFKANPFAPSIDRIDSHKGYTENNCRVILWALNSAIGEFGLDTMLPIFKSLNKP